METDVNLLLHLVEAISIIAGVVWKIGRIEARLDVQDRLLRILLRRSGVESEGSGD